MREKARFPGHFAALALCLFVLSVFGTDAHAAAKRASPPLTSPQATLVEFYHWYLDALMKHRVPIKDDGARIATYVGRARLQNLKRRMNSPEGLDEDYFTRAQDYFDDWADNVAVSDVQIAAKTATANVILGATEESRHPLALQLLRENGRWKIARVSEPPAKKQ